MLARRRIPNLMSGLPKTRQGLAYAERAHSGQRRKIDGAPLILHPGEVAALLYEAGAPDHVIAAGALHDIVEDHHHGRGPERLRRRSHHAPRIALTDDEHITDHDQRKAAAREQAAAGQEALMILAADKISKTRELKLEIAIARQRNTAIATVSRLRRSGHYEHCLQLLEQHLPGSPLVTDLRAGARAAA